jgi:3-deoxy-D-manno-octulosonic-acid transferase
MNGARIAYNTLAPLGAAGAHAAAFFLPKMREAVGGRRGWRARWEALRELPAPPVWFHVASVGEFEQARPLISLLEREHPGIPVMLTFASPSGYHFARRRETVGAGSIRFIDYLPFDLPGAMRRAVAVARPRLLVTVKFDLWPNHIWEADARKVPVVLIDATLSPSSGRLRAPARWIYRDIYARIASILAISAADAERFARAAPGHPGISVAGDTRFDRVMERWQQRSSTRIDLPDDGCPTLIAGSTWPADEAHLLPALARLLCEHPRLRAVLVPHEPVAAHVEPLRRWAAESGLPFRVMSESKVRAGVDDGAPAAPGGGEIVDRTREPQDAAPRIVILDKVGVLAEAYRHAHVAYVGGAFSTGVHSVIEPAIAGIPVVFGPRHDNSFEAQQLLEQGAAATVRSAGEIHTALGRYLSDDALRRRAGDCARAYVQSQLGATEKCMAALRPWL